MPIDPDKWKKFQKGYNDSTGDGAWDRMKRALGFGQPQADEPEPSPAPTDDIDEKRKREEQE